MLKCVKNIINIVTIFFNIINFYTHFTPIGKHYLDTIL